MGKGSGEPYTFIDLFAGIGGFHLAFHNEGAKCVFVSEWDEPARKTYYENYKDISPEIFTKSTDRDGNPSQTLFAGDITKVDPKDIPDFDILTAGFPCQPFSQAGFKKGFDDNRGTLFFNVAQIIKAKRPKAFFLENVRGLLKHGDGQTFAIIKDIIENELGYSLYYKIVRASDYGVPQHRPRLYMVGFRDKSTKFEFPEPVELKITMSDVFGGQVDRKIGYTLRVGGRGSGLGDRRNWDTYLVDGEVRRIGPKEGLKMQGFPDSFVFPVSDSQAMKQLGNSVAVPAIQAVAHNIIKALENSKERAKNSARENISAESEKNASNKAKNKMQKETKRKISGKAQHKTPKNSKNNSPKETG